VHCKATDCGAEFAPGIATCAEGLATLKPAQRWTLTFVLAVAASIPLFPHSPEPQVVPFRCGGPFGVMLVRGEVNGVPTSFILDTGSNHTIISSQFVRDGGSLRNVVETAEGSGYMGRGVFTKASLKVGPMTWRDREILVMNLQDISKSMGENVGGLLGMDFLQEFEVVIVDLHKHELVLK
jgi:Aspartyl protease